jgi:release factor glutamine methyltransferase
MHDLRSKEFSDICNMKVPTNRIKDVVNHYVNEIIDCYGKEESFSLILMLTEHFFNIDRLKLAMEPDFRLSESELLTIHFAVKELKKYKPVQYIIGHTVFFNRKFTVNAEVLIPRSETEELVQKVIGYVAENPNINRILDIGTGSGCVAVTLALELTQAEVSACDISNSALKVAAENAKELGGKVGFFECDILHENQYSALPVWDLIVSNPPYVTETDKKQMEPNVIGWEPHLALFVTDDDPLIFYKSIIQFCKNHLSKGGHILVEINELFGDQLVDLFQKNKFSDVMLHFDFHDKHRFISAIKY